MSESVCLREGHTQITLWNTPPKNLIFSVSIFYISTQCSAFSSMTRIGGVRGGYASFVCVRPCVFECVCVCVCARVI